MGGWWVEADEEESEVNGGGRVGDGDDDVGEVDEEEADR